MSINKKSFGKKAQPIIDYIDEKFDELKGFHQSKNEKKYLTANEVAKLLCVTKTTVYNMTSRGILEKYQISGRILYKASQVENSIIKIK